MKKRPLRKRISAVLRNDFGIGRRADAPPSLESTPGRLGYVDSKDPHLEQFGKWVEKTEIEQVRECIGYTGGKWGSNRHDFSGIQLRRDGVIEPVQWGPERPTAQDADTGRA